MTDLQLSKKQPDEPKEKGKFSRKTKFANARCHQVRGRTAAKAQLILSKATTRWHVWVAGGHALRAVRPGRLSVVSGPHQNQSEDNT